MPDYKTSAIILRTYDFKDFDKIVVLYSKDRGLIRAIAKGIKRPKSRLGGRLEPLMASELILYEGRNLDIVNQCSAIEYFKNLRKDLKKLTFAMYYAELAMAFGLEKDPGAQEFYQFLFDSFKELENCPEEKYYEHLLVSFQYRLIKIAGYEPMLNYCNACAEKIEHGKNVYLNSHQGALICEKCSEKMMGLVKLEPELYNYLRAQDAADKQILDNTEISIVIKAHCIMLDYIKQKTDYKLKTPNLIEDICLI
jgi:DNA repair protein RecO (recombination protein O)